VSHIYHHTWYFAFILLFQKLIFVLTKSKRCCMWPSTIVVLLKLTLF